MAKPKFDPNKPFEIISEQKPKFDPSKPFQPVDEKIELPFVPDDVSALEPVEAFLKGASDPLTMGYSKELGALLEMPFDPQRRGYKELLKEGVQRREYLEGEYPSSSTLGSAAGLAGSMALPTAPLKAASVAKGSKVLPETIKAIARGLGEAFLYNPSTEMGDDTLQLEQRLENVTNPLNLAASVALPAAAGGIKAREISKASKGLPTAEESAILRQLGLGKKQRVKALEAGAESPQSIKQISKYASENKLIGDAEKIYNKSSEKLENIGKQIGSIYKNTKNKINEYVSKNQLTPEVTDYLAEGFNFNLKKPAIALRLEDELSDSSNYDRVLSFVDSYLTRQQSKFKDANPDIEQLFKWKRQLQKEVAPSYLKNFQELPELTKAKRIILEEIDNSINAEIKFADKFTSGNDAAKLKQLNKEYSTLSTINDSAMDRYQGEFALKDISGSIAPNLVGSVRDKVAQAIPYAIGKAAMPTSKIPINIQRATLPLTSGGITYDGVPEEQTMEVLDPVESQMYEMQMQKIQSPMERAKKLNLLRKHGRIVVDQ